MSIIININDIFSSINCLTDDTECPSMIEDRDKLFGVVLRSARGTLNNFKMLAF